MGFGVAYLNNEIDELARICTHKTIALWASCCAGHVMELFEKEYPREKPVNLLSPRMPPPVRQLIIKRPAPPRVPADTPPQQRMYRRMRRTAPYMAPKP